MALPKAFVVVGSQCKTQRLVDQKPRAIPPWRRWHDAGTSWWRCTRHGRSPTECHRGHVVGPVRHARASRWQSCEKGPTAVTGPNDELPFAHRGGRSPSRIRPHRKAQVQPGLHSRSAQRGARSSLPRASSRLLPSHVPATLTTWRVDARILTADMLGPCTNRPPGSPACYSHKPQWLAIQLALRRALVLSHDRTRHSAPYTAEPCDERARRPPRWAHASSATRDARASRRNLPSRFLHPF